MLRVGHILAPLTFALVAPAMEAEGLFPPMPTPVQVSNCMVFEEPLRSLGSPAAGETEALAQALDTFVAKGSLERYGPLEAFLKAYPDSVWGLALRVDLGLLARHTGQVGQALTFWEEAWASGKALTDPVARDMAHRALGELLEVNAALGRPEKVGALLAESQGRRLSGLITEKVAAARESLAFMRATPYHAFQCGPVALSYIKALDSPFGLVEQPNLVHGGQGTSLTMNAALAKELHLSLQMAKRAPGSPFPVPSVVHFKTGHFSALLFRSENKSLLQDPALGNTWVSDAVLDQETSGYALIPAGVMPAGWETVSEAEGNTVWGKGAWGPGRPDDTRPNSRKLASSLQPLGAGLPVLAYHANLVSLNVTIPAVDYQPRLGPRVTFAITYNQHEYNQPQVFDYCNLGPKWTFSYLSCLKDDTTTPLGDVTMCVSGGGGLLFQAKGDGTFKSEGRTQARLTRLPAGGYAVVYPDGLTEFFELSDRAWGLRRTVLTRIQDQLGREVRLTWDPMLRLTAITDAAGQTTNLDYGWAHDPLKVTGVSDPFGQKTTFQYDPSGILVGVLDATGRATRFEYGPTPEDPNLPLDALTALATPGGSYHFRGGELRTPLGLQRWIETSSAPSGPFERIEGGAGYAAKAEPDTMPRIPELDEALYRKVHPTALNYRETRFWTQATLDPANPDPAKAVQLRWGHGPGGYSSGILVSEKVGQGPRHVFVNAGDFWGGAFPAARHDQYPLSTEGELRIGKTFGDLWGSAERSGQLAPVYDGDRDLVSRDYWVAEGKMFRTMREFDLLGRPLLERLASGGTRTWTWEAATGVLLSAKDFGEETPTRFTYDAQHRLKLLTPPKGPAYSATYDTKGRLQGWSPAKGAVWTFHRDAQGRLDRATRGPQSWTFSFDARNRLTAVKTPRGDRRTVFYDDWDRPIRAVGTKGKAWVWRYRADGKCERKEGQVWRSLASGAEDFWGLGLATVPGEGMGNPCQSLLEGTDHAVLRPLLFPAQTR